MWIEHTKSGLRMVDRVKIDGKTKRISVPLVRDTAQARRKAMEEMEEKKLSLSTPISESRVADVIQMYLNRGIRESTRICHERSFNKVLEALGDVRLSSITAPMVKRKLLETGKPVKTLNGYLIRFRSFLAWCYEYGYINEDISRKLRKFPEKSKPKSPEDLYLEPDELQGLLNQLSGMTYYAVKFLALTGLRVGEMSALTIQDVGDRYISITKSYSVHSKMMTEPKNQSSVREVFIQPELAELIREYKEWRLLYMLSKGIRTDLLFFTRNGTVLSEDSINASLHKISAKYHPHILRHTHVALLAEQGVSLDAIARRLGHISDRTTKDVYFHVTKKQRERDEMALAEIRIL